MVEKTWNTSIRIMFDLPIQTHTFFIEPVSESPHIKNILIKRFLKFVSAVRFSTKSILRNMYRMIAKDVRSVTGSNLRRIMLIVNKGDVNDLSPTDSALVQYRKENSDNQWKINLVKEIIEVRNNILQVEFILEDELENILHYLCVE